MTTTTTKDLAVENCSYVMVTGANAGLGFAICVRLIDEFLAQKPESHALHLIIITRSENKSADTIARLRSHLARSPRSKEASDSRIFLSSEELDLCSLIQIKRASHRILADYPRLDAIICNAGIAGWTGIEWLHALWVCTVDPVHSVTYPRYNIGSLGSLTKAQFPSNASSSSSKSDPEPALGEIFCANVFGHYMLIHYLCPLLNKSPAHAPARIIWVSSLDAPSTAFSIGDPQCLERRDAYASSKRLTDILSLTADLGPTTAATASFFTPSKTDTEKDTAEPTSYSKVTRPRFYLSHPGVVNTEIFPLHYLVRMAKLFSFYAARWFGSPWHAIEPYKGASSAAWLALSPLQALEGEEVANGKGKWGAGTNRKGEEKMRRTEVEGWGFGGVVGQEGKFSGVGRKRGAQDLKAGERAEFEELGGEVWGYMEGLRREWEGKLNGL